MTWLQSWNIPPFLKFSEKSSEKEMLDSIKMKANVEFFIRRTSPTIYSERFVVRNLSLGGVFSKLIRI